MIEICPNCGDKGLSIIDEIMEDEQTHYRCDTCIKVFRIWEIRKPGAK